MRLLGVDFSSAPGRRKPIWVACGQRHKDRAQLDALEPLHSLVAFEALLCEPGPWVGGFDLPLGLPRGFIDSQGWGPDLPGLIRQLRAACPDRMAWRAHIDAWRATRPAGERLPHRRCDTALPGGASTTSPLQCRYVPVALMFYEGVPRLLEAGVTLAGQHLGDPQRIALEAYPGWLAKALIGRRSYKNRDDAERRAARALMLERLVPWVEMPAALQGLMRDDASGDPLDALLCLLQAAWVLDAPRYGQPLDMDPLEGWVLSLSPEGLSRLPPA